MKNFGRMKMRRILFVILILTMSFDVSAITKKELIQEDLSKIGIKKEIIDETVKLDYKIGNTMLYFEITGKPEILQQSEMEKQNKLEEIYKKDKRNYIALQKILSLKNGKGKKITEYENDFFKLNIPQEDKDFFLLEYYFSSKNLPKSIEYIKKVKKNTENKYYSKIASLYELMLEMETEEKVDLEKTDENFNEIVNKSLSETEKIDKILNDKSITDKYRISDEEIYSRKLDTFFVRATIFFGQSDSKRLINEYIEKIGNKEISENVFEYNKVKDIFILNFVVAFVILNQMGDDEENLNEKNYQELLEKLKNTKKYKMLEKSGGNLEN